MIKPVLFSICAMFALGSAPVLGAESEDVLDEITIRVLSNDNLPDSITDIELPEVGEKHELKLPDNANEAAGRRNNNAAGNAASNAASNAADATSNAADAAAQASENASEAARDAANNAREHAADAAEKGLDRAPGQNK